jgi:uncharacterized delta-60 repeat protein
MADIEDILSNLNSRYEEIADLVPDLRVFTDDVSYAENEYGDERDNDPLGSQLYPLSNGKYIWVGIDGGDDFGKNVRRYNSDFTLDGTFTCPDFYTGSGNFVRSVAAQSNGKLIIVGHFSNIDGTSYGRIARLNTDGSLDTTFNDGQDGFDNSALVVRVLSDDSILVGGTFNQYNGTSVYRLVKLDANGSLNTTFANNLTTANGQVHEILVDSDGKIYIGGEFPNNIARVNGDGTTDDSFSASFNGRVSSIKKDSNGKLLVGGWFNELNESPCSPKVVRLNSDGSLDNSFATAGAGLNENVQAVAVQSDNKVVVGGWFDELDGERCGHIVRFNADGTKDATFNVGVGIGDSTNDWEGSRVQHILLTSGGDVLCVGNFNSFGDRGVYGFVKLSSTGEMDINALLFRYVSFGINDGGDDMYDNGNFLNTNLTQPFEDAKEDNVNRSLSIPYTHTSCLNENNFWQADMEEDYEAPFYNPLMDGQVASGSDYFGEGSNYFTNLYPGMFVMVATNVNIEEFSVTGEVGSDSSTQNESSVVVVHQGATYTVFMKFNREGDGGESDGEPSVNHLIIVPGDASGLTQLINEDGDSYDDHCVRGLSGRGAIAFLLIAREDAQYLSNEDAEAVALKFLDVIGGLSSVQTYSATGDSDYDLSPHNVNQVGEGSLDTAIVIVNGERVSIQRAGYYEVVNSQGGRKIVYAMDGESWDDTPNSPESTSNPNGHPTFGSSDTPAVTEQVIPVGNPLSR